MGLSATRNSIIVHRDAGVWRATLGADGNTGVSSTSDDPFKALELTIGKAREQGWAFDETDDMAHDQARSGMIVPTVTEGHQIPDQGAESGEDAETLATKLEGRGERIHAADDADAHPHARGHKAASEKGEHHDKASRHK